LNRGVLQLSAGLMRSNIELMEVLGSAIAKRDSDTDLHNYRVATLQHPVRRDARSAGKSPYPHRRGVPARHVRQDRHQRRDSAKPKADRGGILDHENPCRTGHEIVAKSTTAQRAGSDRIPPRRFDGSVTCRGLKGESIPLAARIFAIVDVFDALNSRRPYKDPFPPEVAMRILAEGRGSHFDPRLFDVFEKIAAGLLAEISDLTEGGLRAQLHDRVTKYFFDGSDYWNTSGCPAWLAEQCG
jgi:hypothetical protein